MALLTSRSSEGLSGVPGWMVLRAATSKRSAQRLSACGSRSRSRGARSAARGAEARRGAAALPGSWHKVGSLGCSCQRWTASYRPSLGRGRRLPVAQDRAGGGDPPARPAPTGAGSQARVREARDLIRRGKFAHARVRLRQVLDDDPGNSEAKAWLAETERLIAEQERADRQGVDERVGERRRQRAIAHGHAAGRGKKRRVGKKRSKFPKGVKSLGAILGGLAGKASDFGTISPTTM